MAVVGDLFSVPGCKHPCQLPALDLEPSATESMKVKAAIQYKYIC